MGKIKEEFSKIKALIFDVDGVLAQSVAYLGNGGVRE